MGRRRPGRPESLKPSLPSLRSSRTSEFSFKAFIVGKTTSWIQSSSARTEKRNLEIRDDGDVDVPRSPALNRLQGLDTALHVDVTRVGDKICN